MLVDKSRAEEVAAILAHIEERKQQETDDRKASEELAEQNRKRGIGMRLYNFGSVVLLIENCKSKDRRTRGYQEALTEKGRQRILAWQKEKKWGGYVKEKEQEILEYEVDSTISGMKAAAESSTKACERLKEADIEIAGVEAKNKKAFDPSCQKNCYSR
jgi:hypothetical protein